MAERQLISPTIPVSSPSDKPARSAANNGLSGRDLEKRDSGSNCPETVLSSTPDFGPDVRIDRGAPVVTYTHDVFRGRNE